MRAHSASFDPRPECELVMRDPDTGWRMFGFYETWNDACRNLQQLAPDKRHLNEIISFGALCKGYLDIDLAGTDDAAGAFQPGNLVLAEQELDALGQAQIL